MNNKVSTGIWLVFLGLIILLHNLDIIPFNFYAIIKFWPLALVSIGVSLLFQGKPKGALITTIINILICIFLLVVGATPNNFSHSGRWSNSNTYPASYGEDRQQVSIDYHDTETASIEINGGAAKYIINDSSNANKLFEATTPTPNIHLDLEEKNDARNKLTLNMKTRGSDAKQEPVEFFFNSAPLWDITFNVGAVAVDGDFSNHRFNNFAINSGASSFKLKYGKPKDGISKIEINTAASSIKLSLPKNVEYAIKSDNVISSIKINGQKKRGNGHHYATGHYSEATDKYYIEISGAANSFSLETY